MNKDKQENAGLPNEVARGINGIFRGLTGLVNAATKLTEQANDSGETLRTGSVGTPDGVQAAYGVSVRMGRQRPKPHSVKTVRVQTETAPGPEQVWEPITDVFDEGDYCIVVAEFSGFDESVIHWKVIGNALLIDAVYDHRVCHKELLLPSAVKEDSITSSFKNGILELRLWKQ